MLRRTLLICGVLSSVVYVAADVLAAVFHRDYHSFASRFISELMARGAPSERLVDPLFLLYGGLLVAFGVGVWLSPGPKRRLHLTAGLIIASAAVGFLGPTLFEMNVRGSGGDPSADVRHIALTGVLSMIILLFITSGAFVLGRAFRIYSFVTIAVMLVFGTLTAFASRALGTGDPTPWIGALERVNIGACLLWVAVLAVSLLRPRQVLT